MEESLVSNSQVRKSGSEVVVGLPWVRVIIWLFMAAGVALVCNWSFKPVSGLLSIVTLLGGVLLVLLVGGVRFIRSQSVPGEDYRLLVEGSDEIFFRTNTEGILTFLNAAWAEVTESECIGSLGKPLEQFVYPADRERFAELIAPLCEQQLSRVTGELRMITGSGSFRWVEMAISELGGAAQPGRRSWAGIIRNITTKRLTEDALRENEERYRRIFQNIQDVYFEISLGGVIVEISPSIELVTGHSRDQLIGQPFEILCAEASEARRVRETMQTQNRIIDHEIELRNRRGSYVPCSINARSVVDEMNTPMKIVGSMRDISERKQAENEIRQLAYHDTLTGLPNRSLFNDRLEQALAYARRHSGLLAILYLDLDRFKDVNDTLGHCSGDRLLQAAAQRLAACIRNSDTVARLGGDEFVILLTSIKSDREVSIVAEKILTDLAEAVNIEGHEVFTTTSMGVVLFPHDGSDVETLLKHADMAMYEAKEKGRNNYQFFSKEMNHQAVDRHQLESKLRRALERDEFSLFYQPQWDMQNRRLVGFEALLRWSTEADGMIPPNRFIPVAEDTGLIRPIGEWVLKTACRQLKAWQQMGFTGLRIAVNISARQFRQPDLVSKIDRILAETGLNPQCLELELTESYLMEDADAAIRTLEFLKVRGIQLAIDDFGTGYSSLSYLKNFPIDRIKIDQSFVRDVTVNRDDAAIVEAIIAMGQSLDLDLIAEGVEGAEQLKFLIGRNCFEMQGYFFARPMPADEMERYLQDSYRRRSHSGRAKNDPVGTELVWNKTRVES